MNRLDEWNDAGMTPLMRAVFRGDLEEVQKLLEAGADPDRAMADGTPPLWRKQPQCPTTPS
jgi:ankyrin repeat protein